eukprot:m.87486 g.87486  ORF g.87486 m.87486 type:complete len:464 (-) comp9703_c0_seq2:1742-3133(-)
MSHHDMGGWTYRTGRSYAHERPTSESWVFRKVVLPILAAGVLVGVAYGLYHAEYFYKHLSLACTELDDQVLHLDNLEALSPAGLGQHTGHPVHFVSNWTGSAHDDAFGIRLDHALRLKRETEYCQWQEWATESCETCDDGEGGTRSCNCVTTYHYDKGWRSHTIPSLLFDQPFNHMNPQRDPYPSASILADNVQVGGGARLEPELLANLRAPTRKVFFTPRTVEVQSWFFKDAAPRNEGVSAIRDFLSTPAYINDNFLYTNHDGWFFSPYERGSMESAFRRLGQFLEGSLLDFQIGDLFSSCTAGDIRVRYRVADPREISVVGTVHGDGTRTSVGIIDNLKSTEMPVGFVHAGIHTFAEMVQSEYDKAHTTCLWWRLGALLWGLVAERTIAWLRGGGDTTPINGFMVAGLALLLIGSVWSATSGLSDWTGSSTSLWTVVALGVSTALIASGRTNNVCAAKKSQ